MKNAVKALGTIVFTAIIAATLIACGPPRLTGTVSIEGTPHIGETLAVNISALGGSGIITYQWLRDDATAIADTNAYTIQPADFGSAITVTVVRSDNSGSVTSLPITSNIYSIGAVGPGGGIIFYHDPEGFTMSDTGETVHHLEAAPVGFRNLTWASRAFAPSNYKGRDISYLGGTGNWINIEGTNMAIGTGRKNTALILAVDVNAPAALACRNYSNNGFTDWFLPSFYELDQLYKNRAVVNNLYDSRMTDSLWSSTQDSIEHAICQDSYGRWSTVDWAGKIIDLSVRAIRAF